MIARIPMRRLGDANAFTSGVSALFGSLFPVPLPQDVTDQLSQYSSDQIMQAFQSLQQAYSTANQEYTQDVQWLRDNAATLTPDGLKLYQDGLAAKTDEVNGYMQAVSQFAAVLNNLGFSASAPGLTGWRRLGSPLIVVAVLVTIIVIVIGAVAWEYIQSKRNEWQTKTQQAKTMLQAQTNVPALVAAGWTPQQIHDYLQQQQEADKPSVLDQIPWGTLAITAGVIFGVKAVFG